MSASLLFVLPPALPHARRNLPQALHHRSSAPVAAWFLCRCRSNGPCGLRGERTVASARKHEIQGTTMAPLPSGHKNQDSSRSCSVASKQQRSHAFAQPQSTRSFQVSVRRFAPSALVCFAIQVKTQIQNTAVAQRVRPNPSIERTRNGRAHLAFISFWAKRALPLRSAHVKR